MAAWNPQANEIFLAALDIPAAEERRRWLDQACGEDTLLRAQVEALLEAHDKASGFLSDASPDTLNYEPVTEALEGAAAAPTPGDEPSTVIGPYKLLQKLGEGGMGVVWLAEQEVPIRRRVALKIIKPGMDSAQVIARFEQERQALAVMDHPNIAKILDAGKTDQGLPYFVMELVKGIPITRYCDQQHVPPHERLSLLMLVCDAVQHAHQKGIIHRDLKPSNILIGLYDGHPVPKIIDFGVAKAIQQNLTERTMFTQVGSIIGTLEYMAPEQAELNNLDIDTRADIYSLGVLIYEMLTGAPPFTAQQLRGAAFDEMLRMIREQEPSRPSTKLSSSDSLPAIAAARQIEPRRLTRLVSGDLDWIVMKCLEKERGRRYTTASALADDLRSFLSHEPVAARPPSATYRLRKLVRRHRVAALSTALVALALVVGFVGTTLAMLRARAAEELASERLQEVTEAQAKTAAALEESEAARRTAEAVGNFMVEAFGKPDPAADALNIKVVDVLASAAKKLEQETATPPELRAELWHVIGRTYQRLGLDREALEQYRKAHQLRSEVLGPSHDLTLNSLNNIAYCLADLRDTQAALPIFEQLVEERKKQHGPDHESTFGAMYNLSTTYSELGRKEDAVKLSEQALEGLKRELGENHENTIVVMVGHAAHLQASGQSEAGLAMLEDAVRRAKQHMGEKNRYTILAQSELAGRYRVNGQHDRALEILLPLLPVVESSYGEKHPTTCKVLEHIARAYVVSGKVSEGLPYLERNIALLESMFGENDAKVLSSQIFHAQCLGDTKLEEAIASLQKVADKCQQHYGADHSITKSARHELATLRAKAPRDGSDP